MSFVLFVDYSSAFTAIVPSRLIFKLCYLGLGPSLCSFPSFHHGLRCKNISWMHHINTWLGSCTKQDLLVVKSVVHQNHPYQPEDIYTKCCRLRVKKILKQPPQTQSHFTAPIRPAFPLPEDEGRRGTASSTPKPSACSTLSHKKRHLIRLRFVRSFKNGYNVMKGF